MIKRSLILGLILINLAAAGTVKKTGTTAAKFLSIPVGGRAGGMGGAVTAISDDPSSMYWNPAGIASIDRKAVYMVHSNWVADIPFNYIGMVIPMGVYGTLGLNLTTLSSGEMEVTTEYAQDGNGEKFTAGSFALGLSYARNLTDQFQLGGTLKYIQESIWNTSARTVALDIGTIFKTPIYGILVGASISNFGPKMKMSGDDLMVQKDIDPLNQGNNPNLNAYLATDKFELPLKMTLSLAKAFINTDNIRLLSVVEGVHPNDNSESVNWGGELAFWKKMISVRGGMQSLFQNNRENQFTFGAGIRYQFGPQFGMNFDYAYQSFEYLNQAHHFSLGLNF
ncbi:MAG: PorV/PorQ family protein [Candidatus Delongbacteria bacterium]|nr:PorV/PorQ family protein [Candidatus Delongbacteria bacterium]